MWAKLQVVRNLSSAGRPMIGTGQVSDIILLLKRDFY